MVSKYQRIHYINIKLYILVLISLIIVFLFYISSYNNNITIYDNDNNHYKTILEDIRLNDEMINKLCLFKRNNLKYYIWSHRSYISKNFVDGSYNVVHHLLTNNIRNFDIDVSCILINNGKNCKYVVAHPSRIKVIENNILENSLKNDTQTLNKFLKQIYQYLLSINEINKLDIKHNTHQSNEQYVLTMPIITIEMKFTDIIHQFELIKTLKTSPMANHIAFITTNPSIVTLWYNHMHQINNDISLKLPGIAIAYRSIPLTNNDYIWFANTNKTQLYIDSTNLINDSSLPPTQQLSTFQMIPNIKLPNSTSTNNYWQIHMPDKKLLTLNSNLVNNNNPNRLVISWVIDQPQDMFDSLLVVGVNGIISNNPIELLSLLTYTYDRICINHTFRIH